MKDDFLIRYLKDGITPFHLVKSMEADLRSQGFLELRMEERWDLEENKKYFINHHGTTLLSFYMPKKESLLAKNNKMALRIAAAHTDYPCLRLKANPDLLSDKYEKLNVEVYGGAIVNTWLDRPLGIAGRVAVASEDALQPKMYLYDSKRPVVTIPNLAIHMNRDVNKGVEINKQTQLLPLFGIDGKEKSFVGFLAEEIGVKQEDILDFELQTYLTEEPAYVGRCQDILSAARIDNISSCAAINEAMCSLLGTEEQLILGVCFDHEEVGSKSKQGAGSAFLSDVVEKIYKSAGLDATDAKDAIYQGMMLSADVAHALHPNYMEKADITSKPILGAGLAIKEASSQSYATDCQAIAITEQIARSKGISYQKYTNRSDIPGGSTLGAISSALLPMRTVDIGIPILAMHSVRECMGKADYEALEKLILAFYQI